MHFEAGHFALLAFSSLFSVINPISAAPIFVALTPGASAGARRRVALRACLAALGILALFAAAGGAIFAFYGITVPAFQIAGGIIFTALGIKAVQEDRHDEPGTTGAPASGADPSIVPLGIPLIAGPGAISTMMVLVGQSEDAVHRMALGVALAANIALTFLILLAAPAIVERIGETGQRIVAKVMGLITAVIGVQFIINGVTTVLRDILRNRGAA
jgi:multiple antibiotic resistance protein